MSKQPGEHPDLEELTAFDGGRLPPAVRAAIEGHVAGCDACCRRLETLPEDAFTALVRSAGSGPSPGPADVPSALVGHPRYRVLDEVGRGGMGIVWKAAQLLLDRVVALKVIHPHLASRPGFVQRFQREVRALARLNHPNIAQAHDAEQTGELHFLVMEFVEGRSLDRVLDQRGRLPPREVLDLARQAALGLAHAHERGILHRDLKPHNLIVSPAGVLKIVDFGLAGLMAGDAQAVTAASALLGTPDYTAPEQALDPRSADPRSDLYSLGCTLYHLLTGQPPFPGGTALRKLVRHQEESPRPVRDLCPDVPPPLAALVARLMHRNPARRPGSAALVARALAELAEGPAPVRRRRRLLVPTLAALLLAGAAVAGLAWPRSRHAVPDQPAAVVSPPGQDLELATPALVAQWKQAGRDAALDWLRRNIRGVPNADIAADTARDIAAFPPSVQDYQLALGEALLKTGRAALLHVRMGDLFAFELSPAQRRTLGLVPGVRRTIHFSEGQEARRARPPVRLSGLHIDDADALPRERRITGTVRYEGLVAPGEHPHIRMTRYADPVGKRVTGMYYLKPYPPAAAAEVRFQFGWLDAAGVQKGPVVVFVELACWRNGQVVIESNTLAALVTPRDEP